MSAPSVSVRWMASASRTTPVDRRVVRSSESSTRVRNRSASAKKSGPSTRTTTIPGAGASPSWRSASRGTSPDRPVAAERRGPRSARSERSAAAATGRRRSGCPAMIPTARIPSHGAHEEDPVGPVDPVVAPHLGRSVTSPSIASITIAPSVALGRSSNSPARNSMRQQHEDGVDQGRHLRLLPGRVGDRGLRQAAVDREAADEPGGAAGDALGDQLLVRGRSRSRAWRAIARAAASDSE